jgi:hypothetical protein
MANTHPIRNRISLVWPPEKRQATEAALLVVEENLHPELIGLMPEERRDMAKLGPRTSDFVKSAIGYMRSMPQYLPGFVDIEEFQRDLDAVELLRALLIRIDTTRGLIADTMMLAGSEAFAAGLSCYDALKTAAKHGSPEAVAAVNDLAARLPTRGPARPAPVAEEVPPAAPAAGKSA